MRSFVRLPYVFLALLALCLVVATAPARAQLPGGYASHTDFIVGSWKWERAEPRQTVLMRFDRGGAFFFHNMTTGLQHFGSFSAPSARLDLQINRSCEDNGARCADRSPPLTLNYPFTPAEANVFMSESERWERQAK